MVIWDISKAKNFEAIQLPRGFSLLPWRLNFIDYKTKSLFEDIVLFVQN